MRGIHRSPVNTPHKGQRRWAFLFSLICAWINVWVNNHEAGDLRRLSDHYDVTVMTIRRIINNDWHQSPNKRVFLRHAVMHVGIAKPRWWGKRFRHTRRMRNPQFCVSGKRPINAYLSGADHTGTICILPVWSAPERYAFMGLLPDTQNCGLRMRLPETFSPPPRFSDPDMHHGMPGSLSSGFLWSQWR